MAQDPEVIRRDIEHTRRHMGDTVDALAYKADVPTRTREKVSGAVGSVKERFGGAAEAVSDRTPDGRQVKQGARRAAGVAQENPLGLAIGAAAVGFLAGMLVPGTRVEDERLGPISDQVKQTGQEALEHGKQVAQEAAGAVREHAQEAMQDVKDTTQSSAQEHGEQLKQSAQQRA